MIQISDRKILITGSQGFIGSHLLTELIIKNKIIGVNVILDKRTKNYIPLKKDILKLTAGDALGKLYGIVHLAAITDIDFCNKNPHKCFATNVLGTQKVLEIARKKDCKLVYVSTSHVYGKPIKLPITEGHPKNPESIYAASKLAGEICCEGYANTYGLDISVVRLFSVYGPNSPSYLVTSRIFSQINNRVIRLGNLHAKRDFIYVKDAVNGVKTVLEKSKRFNVYNIGMGKSYSILAVCNLIKKISAKTTPIQSVRSYLRKNDINEIRSNSSKIRKLGWKPKFDLKKGLELTLKWNHK